MGNLRMLTAGESHGPALVSVVEGFPSGVPVSRGDIDRHLRRRQGGYGRGGRMEIERDSCRFLSGVRHGETLGSPITLMVGNRDWANWEMTMSADAGDRDSADPSKVVTRPRPGHADLVGGMKYGHTDLRNVLERASARETAARVASGALALRFLSLLGVTVASHVVSIGGIGVPDELEAYDFRLSALRGNPYAADVSPVRCLHEDASRSMVGEIDAAKGNGDSLGGVFEVVVFGMPPGVGSYVQWDRRLDARLSMSIMGIQAIKGVEFGLGFQSARMPGSEVHDEITYGGSVGFSRSSNNSGGLEGGMTTGQPLVVRAAMKPIPTLYKPLQSVDIATLEPFGASVERSDSCAVPAAAVVAEAVVAWTVADALLETLGGDSLKVIRGRLAAHWESIRSYPADWGPRS